MNSSGFVGVFSEPFTEERIRACVDLWISRFDKVEQVCPGKMAGDVTLVVESGSDMLVEKSPQFRVLSGENFAWIYITQDRYVIETTGFPEEGTPLCFEVLLDLPGITEIVDQINERRLDELEAQGLM